MKNLFKTAIIVYSFIFCFLIESCQRRNKIKVEYYSTGGLKKITTPLGNNIASKLILRFRENGEISSILRYDTNNKAVGEQVWFYPSGIIDTKIPYSLNNKAYGNAYYFYDTTGALKSDRYFRNNKQVIWGADYWGDSLSTMKSVIHFDDSGRGVYKKYFDRLGNFISEEGINR